MRQNTPRSRDIPETASLSPFENVETIFHQALLIDGVAERRQWIAYRCGADAVLRGEVESLLDAHEKLNADDGESAASCASVTPVPEVPDECFGAYRAVRLLGRGGMSAVYLAERTDGRFDKVVAVKLMAAHLAGDDFRRRFETEGKFLAALRHPNITSLLDGGVSSAGHPYLAMEYVEGEALDDHCDRRHLNIESRLRLFLQVSDAVEYAHRNLILHRDLKPGNILVDNEGQARLLDFGTASLLTGTAWVTATHARMLTPRYASPEQLRGLRPGVAGDVFSLGVILYELLTGAWPFGDPDSVIDELQRVAGDKPPTRPALAVTQDAADHRSLSCERLRRTLGGDLSAIMLKALEDQPERRYLTVGALVDDLNRYLSGRPVEARAQTTLYRLGKFVRRRWIAVSVLTFMTGAILIAAVFAVLEARSARSEAMKSDQVNQFLTEMLATNDNDQIDVGKYTVEQMLDAADQRLQLAQDASDGKLQAASIGGPLTLAVLHKSLAASYLAQQRYDKVQFHLDRAIPVFRAAGDYRDLAETIALQADSEKDQGHYPKADRFYQEALDCFRRAGDGAPAIEIFQTKRRYAQLLSLLMHTRLQEARAMFDDLIAMGARDRSIPRVAVAVTMANRGVMLIDEGKLPQAEAAVIEALAIGRKENDGGAWEYDPLFALTIIYGQTHKYQAGKQAAQRMVDVDRNNFGPDSLSTAQARSIWATFAAETGESAAAAEAIRDSMRVIEKAIHSPSLNLWHAARNASNVMRRTGQYADAERYARESLAVALSAHLPESDPRLANSWECLGRALREEKKDVEATTSIEKAEAIYRRAGPDWVSRVAEMRKLMNIDPQ